MTDDEEQWGPDAWVYCNQHLKPHSTGWCTVDVKDKVCLAVDSQEDAYRLCREWGFPLHGEGRSRGTRLVS